MLSKEKSGSWGGFVSGLSVGLLVGVGMLLGALAASKYQPAAGMPLPEHLLHAVATDGGDTMAVATGPISDGVEGIFLLDFLTGNLQCLVVNPRTATIAGAFEHNVIADLGVERGKRTKYIMTTGNVNWRTMGGNVKPADSVLYVANDTAATWVAYTLPWNRSAASFNAPQVAPFTVIGSGRLPRAGLGE